MIPNKHLIVIAGPTASGKTATAIEIAEYFNTVVISADSRQFYKEIPIGTAAPSKEEMCRVKHYMVGNLSVEDKYDVADYEHDVICLLKELFKFHDAVVLTGGSGLYIDAVCNGIDIIPDISPAIRQNVCDMLSEKGLFFLQDEVKRIDPDYYDIVDKMNPRRLQRALEVYYQTGRTFSSFRKNSRQPRDFNIIKTAILWERAALISRINRRVECMVSAGLVDEARSMYPKRHLNSLNTVGYKEMFEYFDGITSLEEAVGKIKVNTRQYAKRQMTWLRKNNDYQWFEPNSVEAMKKFIVDGMNIK
ncbi:MAG: tRNA (adenosine(37)-N6)-dimethylallyltransferase MiaA [Candidatus Limimorpha sp.]